MRVMVLGAGGMLGQDVVASCPANIRLLPYTSDRLDITETERVAVVVGKERPDVIINLAAYTAVDRAESERQQAFAVNGEAVGTLGKIARQHDAFLLHLSTDYVFDGTSAVAYVETSPTNPLNVYGASKRYGEALLSRTGAKHAIVRTQWLFGFHGRSFPRTMRERARAGEPTRVVNDQFGCPTYTADLAIALWSLAAAASRQALPAVVHVVNRGRASWYDLAVRVFRRYEATDRLSACGSADMPRPAARPRNSVLSDALFTGINGRPLREWEHALEAFLDELDQSAPSERP